MPKDDRLEPLAFISGVTK